MQYDKSQQEHQYTSTGVKFWAHSQQMFALQNETPGVVSTHISPESRCNLKCSYCSVSRRTARASIEIDLIKTYVETLQRHGLRAVILTGGGEPTLYDKFNELVLWLKHDRGLSVALITNGTTGPRIKDEALNCLSWIRLSINTIDGWCDKLNIKTSALNSECIVGCSHIITNENDHDVETTLLQVSAFATKIGAKYVRLLPNCMLNQSSLLHEHSRLDRILVRINDVRFFHQYKSHATPKAKDCHQSYLRPYLSEEPWHLTGIPGTVYPCDSVVLNAGLSHFAKKYQLCAPEDVELHLSHRLTPSFTPCVDCSGCVFTSTIDMLDDWKYRNIGIDRLGSNTDDIKHVEFI